MRTALPAVAAVLACTAACASAGLDPRLFGQALAHRPPGCTDPDAVEVAFLGVDGFLLRRGADAVLTAPLFSHPKLGRLLANRPIRADAAAIDRGLPASWAADVSAILVGHSHYDHLMDVPHIVNTKAPRATVYGSRTMKHLLAQVVDPARLRALNADVDYRMCPGLAACTGDNHGQPGRWIQLSGGETSGRGVRLRALCSRHSPQFAGIRLWNGCADRDGPLPARPAEWMLGDTFAYLIDFLEDGRPVYRVYYQDSSTDPTNGYVHAELLAEKPVDLAILCAGAFGQSRRNPSGILENLEPRHILMGHWEDFFTGQDRALRPLRGHDYRALVAALEAATGAKPWEGRYWFPAPGQAFAFRP